MLSKLKERAKKLKHEMIPVYYALFDKRTPLLAKILAGLTIGYLLSPVDLIPDFIPVIGLLDDIIIIPLLISATIKLIPKAVLDDIRTHTDMQKQLKKNWLFAIPIIAIYGYLIFRLAKLIYY